jgi:epoxyqueuosine reductase
MTLTAAQGRKEDWQQLKEEIKKNAPAFGIDKIGFASADPFFELKDRLQQQREKGYESGFEEPDIDKRVYPELTMPEAKSIISVAVAYPSKLKPSPKSKPGAYRGIISRSAWGEDYHHVLRRRIRRLEQFILERVPDARLTSMADTGVLADRAAAERAGMGWVGKNCSLITPEWGSWVFLGEVITNIPFPPDTPVLEACGECTICLDSCPTGALVGPGQLNAKRCISYLTQSKDFIADELKKKIGNRLYGCDTCQVVCPKNKGKHWDHQPEFTPDPELVKPELKPLLGLSNKQFKAKFGKSAASWRGKMPIQRNALIALGHFRDASAVPLIADILWNDQRPQMRETAVWALRRIGGNEAKQALTEALAREQDERVRQALLKALDSRESGTGTEDENSTCRDREGSHEIRAY